jgi:squalene synthase HpnC
VTPAAQAPFAAPAAEAVMARAGSENFPVALRLLPPSRRRRLLAIYGFARLVDELGDTLPGDRPAALDWLGGELAAAYEGRPPEHPLMRTLQTTLRECPLPRAAFERLIEANRLDQRRDRYATWEELRGYCALSADPVGELVLAAFEQSNPSRVELSDSICTALQLVEHCQDVAEDLARGRVYLPAEDLARFGCDESELAAAHASARLRAVIAFEIERARGLFDQGAPLIRDLHGGARLAVAAFLAGGRAALGAIERVDYDVLAGPPRAGHARRLMALGATLLGPGDQR